MGEWTYPPEPPVLPTGTAEEFVPYARETVRRVRAEKEERRLLGHEVSEHPELVRGWEFMALAISETYDLETEV